MSNLLVGVWTLTSFELRTTRGDVSFPFGSNPAGLLVLTEDGYWSVQAMDTRRPRFTTGDVLGGTQEEQAAATRGYVAYAGSYGIHGNRVVVNVRTSLFPNWVGQDQERFFSVEGDRLDLSTRPLLAQGEERTAHLIWERVR